MKRIALSVILALALTTGVAQADVITTYTLSNALTAFGAVITGSFKIDQTTYNYNTNAGFDGGSLVVSGDTFSDLNGAYSFHEYDSTEAIFINSFSSTLIITIDRPPFTTGSVDQIDNILFDTTSRLDNFLQGTLTAVTTGLSPVPEPSSLALLAGGLGLLGLLSAGTFRRRTLG